MKRLAKYLAWTVFLFVSSCTACTLVQMRYLEPQTVWERWWHETEECLGTTGNFHNVVFYKKKDVTSPCGLNTLACYAPGIHIIIFGYGTEVNETIVRHEMIHALGVWGHPSPPFGVCDKPKEVAK